jgi:uncharacterized membrane protein HdeD (DUF308 family)
MTDVATAPAPAPEPTGTSGFPWWLVLLQGIAALVVGGMLVMKPGITTVVLVQFFGWYWLFAGVFQLLSLFADRTQWGWRVASGLLSIFAGAYIIGSPLMGAAILLGVATLMLGINGVLIGISDLVKATHGGGWGIGILGVLSIIIGGAIALNFPRFMLALPWVWGLFAIVGGIAAIAGSFQIRKAQSAPAV